MAETLCIGVDEAGRGAVLGPLVMAACAVPAETEPELRAAGVADSKGFGATDRAQRQRGALATLIRTRARWWAVAVISPAEVDAAVRRGRLNALERQRAEALLRDAPPSGSVVFDGARLFGPLAARWPNAQACDRADGSHLAVAAASILAKSERDRCFAEIRSRYEARFAPIHGHGYPNGATRRFLQAYLTLHGTLPPETRRSWDWDPVRAVVPAHERGGSFSFDFEG